LGDVDPNGMLAESILNKGDYVMAINSVPCQYIEANNATRLVRQAPKTVTILSKTQRSAAGFSERHEAEHSAELPGELPLPSVSVSESGQKKPWINWSDLVGSSCSIAVGFVLVVCWRGLRSFAKNGETGSRTQECVQIVVGETRKTRP
jgi:hypothetical protein